jgi:hypothetical protein
MSGSRKGEVLLGLGLCLGLSLAIFDLVGARGAQKIPSAAVIATVNGREIRRADYERALLAVAADRREGTVSPQLKRRILDRLIDEELLVQRGLELGLLERDPLVRSALVSSVLSLYATRAEDEPSALMDPGDAELARFLEENQAAFRQPERLRIHRVFRKGEEAQPGDPPDALLPLSKLQDYLGESATAALAELAVGAVLPAAGTRPAFQLVERQEGRMPALPEIRKQVLLEYQRQDGDRRLRAMLNQRRQEAEIHIQEGL